jgi:hypothetical protein
MKVSENNYIRMLYPNMKVSEYESIRYLHVLQFVTVLGNSLYLIIHNGFNIQIRYLLFLIS